MERACAATWRLTLNGKIMCCHLEASIKWKDHVLPPGDQHKMERSCAATWRLTLNGKIMCYHLETNIKWKDHVLAPGG